MFGDFKNSKKQGDAGVGIAIAYFCVNGIPVSIPLTDSQDYDLVVEIDGVLKKIQVRTTNQKKNSSYAVNLRVMGGNTKANFVSKSGTEIVYDFLFAVDGNGSQYLIPKEEIASLRSCLILGEKYERFKIGNYSKELIKEVRRV